jgi:hypothetical protein
MTALESLKTRLKEFEVKYEYDYLFSYEENRGAFVISRVDQMVGNYVEEVMSEWDPDPESKFRGVGEKIDWENSKSVAEQKKSPKADNSSSKKGNCKKLLEVAEEKGKTPIYAYWQDRKKNDHMGENEYDKGVRYLHGSAVFEYLGIENYEEQYKLFLNNISNIKSMIKEDLTNKFDEKFQSFNKSTV